MRTNHEARCALFLALNHEVVRPSSYVKTGKLPRRAEEFQAWKERRDKLRPSTEERELADHLTQLADHRRRRTAKIAKLEAQREAEEAKQKFEAELAERAAACGTSVSQEAFLREEILKKQLQDREQRKSVFNDLSFDVKTMIFEFVSVVPQYMIDDVRFLCTFLPTDDAMPLYQPQVASEALTFVEDCLTEHKEQYAKAAFVAVVIGLSDYFLQQQVHTIASSASSSSSTAQGNNNSSSNKNSNNNNNNSVVIDMSKMNSRTMITNKNTLTAIALKEAIKDKRLPKSSLKTFGIITTASILAGGGDDENHDDDDNCSTTGDDDNDDNNNNNNNESKRKQKQPEDEDGEEEGDEEEQEERKVAAEVKKRRTEERRRRRREREILSSRRVHVPHQQRALYGQMIGVATSELSRQKHVLDLCNRWLAFEKLAIETPCSILRVAMRECLDSWSKRIATQLPENCLTVKELMSANLEAMQRRVKAVEFVGHPTTEAEDIRDMLWDARGTHLPEGSNRSYGKSLTLGQIVSLGIAELPWVRGFAWEDRASRIVSRAEIDITKMMALYPELAALREVSLDVVVDTEEKIHAREIREAHEAEEKRVKAEHEKAMRVRQTAVDAMARRVFQEQGKAHLLGSCEVCGSKHVHLSGLKKPGAPVLGDIAVCRECYQLAYKSSKTIHDLYFWEEIESIVGVPTELDEFVEYEKKMKQKQEEDQEENEDDDGDEQREQQNVKRN